MYAQELGRASPPIRLLPRRRPRRRSGEASEAATTSNQRYIERIRAGLAVREFELDRRAVEAAMRAVGRIQPGCAPASDDELYAAFATWLADVVDQVARMHIDPVRAVEIVSALGRTGDHGPRALRDGD